MPIIGILYKGNDITEKRIVVLFCTMLAAFAVLIGRIAILGSRSDYVEAARGHSVYRLTLATTRGTIYDRSGEPLVNCSYCFKALVFPSAQTAAVLMKHLPPEQYASLEDRLKGNLPFVIPVADGSCECDGIIVYRVPQRYSDSSTAVHLVGRWGENGGESGIEYAYDDWLSGAGGEMSVTCRVSASGRSLFGARLDVTDTTGLSDRGVMLTIDSRIQKIAEDAASGKIKRGAVIVTDVLTGGILAMVSVPSYNRNDVASVLDDPDSPLVNRTVAEYNAGSVFKPVVAAAALDSGFDPHEKYECMGSVDIGGTQMGCINHRQHGEIDLGGAISLSCNTYFITIAQRTGGQKILETARKLGFGSATRLGTRYFSSSGRLPELSGPGSRAALANLSFGQGELTVTPVQVAGMIGAIAREGEYIEPYVVMGLTDTGKSLVSQPFTPERHRAMSRSTARTIADCMRLAVLEGTAKAGASDRVTSAAKTGTAETGIFRNGKRISQAWYAGFFPYEQPRYVCVVLAEDGVSGGSSAGPVFREIADMISRLDEIKGE